MSKKKKIAVLIGSLRKESFTRKGVLALQKLAPSHIEFVVLEIGNLPFFSEDLEATPPQAWTEFRNAALACDALLVATPEYNRSIPGVLKNALDVGSRPYGKNVFAGKPAAVFSSSIGAIGGFGATHHLRQVLAFLNTATLAQPEMYVGSATSLYDASGTLINEESKKYFTAFLTAFDAWIDRILA